jgi:peptidoglycan LD-endopeptidase CwlK
MDAISEEHLREVHPALARRVRELADMCAANGTELRVTCGLRTWGEQDELFDQGRILPGKVVTNAKGGQSAHNFGYAVDIVPADESFPEFVPDWDAMDVRWKMVLGVAKSCGLAEGAEWRTFPDRPHLYLEECLANPDDAMRAAYLNGGMFAVWAMWKISIGDNS